MHRPSCWEAAIPNLPTGTVTFLFSDIEGSTRLWEQHPETMRQALTRHDAIIEGEVARHAGMVVRPRGEGDSRFAVFARASDAVAAAVAIQQTLQDESWPLPAPLRVRMALHTGESDLRDGDYYGPAVNRCARLRAVAHGEQVVLSEVTAGLVRSLLPAAVRLRDLGEHRLHDIERAEHVFQLLHSALPDDFPPLTSLAAARHNLPPQLTSFVGRQRELADIMQALGSARLVTLTGVGGCGKTRLALQVAAELLEQYPDGAWLVELAPVSDPSLVASAVVTALGLREAPGQPIVETLLDALRDKRLLLLDNCEHILDAGARLADALLHGCSQVSILATSREALGIAGEVSRRAPSLTLPDPRRLLPVEQITRYEAVQLFVERATAVRPEFALTERNAPALAQLCLRLDGIPSPSSWRRRESGRCRSSNWPAGWISASAC